MARPSRFTTDQILDAASRLLADAGPEALTVAGVGRSLAAPNGSIYHRFGSRDVLAASVWLRAVERFHEALAPCLEVADPVQAVEQVALTVLRWSREHADDARVLLLYRSSDLLRGGWPAELRERNRAQRRRVDVLLTELCRRLGAVTDEGRRRVVFAAVDLPYAAARAPLSRGQTPSPALDAIVADAAAAVIAGIGTQTPDGVQPAGAVAR